MTTIPTPTRASGAVGTARSPRVLAALTVSEARLYLREPSAVFFGLFFPAVLLLALGLLMPWADQPFGEGPVLSEITAITGYTPIVLALAIGTVGYTTLPPVMGTYREKGVLRRLSTTPLPPSRLLVAQLLINLAMLVIASTLAVLGGALVLGVGMPRDVGVTLLAFVVGAAASMSVGLLIAAVAPTAGASTGTGMLVYMTSLFFAGVWFPLPLMPDVVQTISRFTPLGAASQALAAGWYEGTFPGVELVVMAVWTAVLVPLAAKLFRWT
ncbi:ABC transporter permease [Actinotalea fermentans]|uniref:Transport permease protein n=1 Tax=Actinotalea fermentans TaxID=43671 RepID=A0A511Z0Q6_9CELL|nr:ABC transporter permease [Actinotalea fermentans]KGM16750.1 ABC transporter [Actinotalea fermentans ATCC 43279 = JCM 9966 = DSM 3133]GEN81034.1 transport permease protein [Actinotalea fermentans]